MHTTATLHVHPACTHNRELIERLQATTGRSVIIHRGKPQLIVSRTLPSTTTPDDGGRAA